MKVHSFFKLWIRYLNGFESTANRPSEEPSSPHDSEESLINHSEGQLFLTEAFKLIVDEVLSKGTDSQQKVLIYYLPCHLFFVRFVVPCLLLFSGWCRFVSGKNQRSWLSCWTWSWEQQARRLTGSWRESGMWPSTASKQVKMLAHTRHLAHFISVLLSNT